jgi:hypothetical protein
LKKDTIEKHCGKKYYKEEVDGKWRTSQDGRLQKNASMLRMLKCMKKTLEMIIVRK